ncbi:MULTISPECIES: hypothetical protein [unclassified Blastococcus]
MAWWVWALGAWLVASVAAAVLMGSVLAAAERRERSSALDAADAVRPGPQRRRSVPAAADSPAGLAG